MMCPLIYTRYLHTNKSVVVLNPTTGATNNGFLGIGVPINALVFANRARVRYPGYEIHMEIVLAEDVR